MSLLISNSPLTASVLGKPVTGASTGSSTANGSNGLLDSTPLLTVSPAASNSGTGTTQVGLVPTAATRSSGEAQNDTDVTPVKSVDLARVLKAYTEFDADKDGTKTAPAKKAA